MKNSMQSLDEYKFIFDKFCYLIESLPKNFFYRKKLYFIAKKSTLSQKSGIFAKKYSFLQKSDFIAKKYFSATFLTSDFIAVFFIIAKPRVYLSFNSNLIIFDS